MQLQFLSCFACVDVGTHGLSGHGGEFRDHIGGAGDCLLSADTTTKKYGAASLKVTRASGGAIYDYLQEPCLTASQDEGTLGFWLYMPTDGEPTSTHVALFGWETAGWCGLNSDKKLNIIDASGTVKATMTGALTADTWYWVVLKLNYRQSGGGGTDYWLRLYSAAGSLVESISVSGVGGQATLVNMGQRHNVGSTVYFTYYLDGGYGVAEGWPPICPAFVDGMIPTGVGTYDTFSKFPDTGLKYQKVDEVPDNADTDYIYRQGQTFGTYQSFDHGSSGLSGVNVQAVGLRSMSKVNNEAQCRAYSLMVLNSTDLLSGDYDRESDEYVAGRSRILTATDPDGNHWTIANLDAVEIGNLIYILAANSWWTRISNLVLFAAYGDVDIEIWPPAATASATCPAPTIAVGAPVVVSAVTATATAAAAPPDIVINASVAGEAATAIAEASAPTISISTDATVEGIAAETSAAAPVPSVCIDASVAGETAVATAEAPLPSIQIGASVSGETAVADASAPAPTVEIAASVDAVAAVANAAAPVPSILYDYEISAETAATTAEASAPTVEIEATISGETAAAIASAPIAAVQIAATVSAETAAADAEAPAPTVIGAGVASINAVTATADALAPLPTITASVYTTVNAVTATSEATTSAAEINRPQTPTDFLATATASGIITLTWTKGVNSTHTLVRRKVGSYPTDRSDGAEVYWGEDEEETDEGLTSLLTYYYRAWAYQEVTA